MLSSGESSSAKILSTTTIFNDQPLSTLVDEVLSKIKEKVFKGDLFLLILDDPSSPLTLKALLNQVNLIDASPEVANIILELGIMIEQVVEDHKILPHITKEIKQKASSRAAAWDVATKSTDKAMELEQTKQKNQEEIEGHDRDIASWRKQIRELQAKISEAEKHKNELLKFDSALMAKDLEFGMYFVEKACKLESKLIIIRSKWSLCEKHLELLKTKYLHIKANIPF